MAAPCALDPDRDRDRRHRLSCLPRLRLARVPVPGAVLLPRPFAFVAERLLRTPEGRPRPADRVGRVHLQQALQLDLALQRLPRRAPLPAQGALDEDGELARFHPRRAAREGRARDGLVPRAWLHGSLAACAYAHRRFGRGAAIRARRLTPIYASITAANLRCRFGFRRCTKEGAVL